MKDYETWSFWNKSFVVGLGASILWHLFWFFSITIVVAPQRVKVKSHPNVVSLGPVLDDSIFRTLVETKPQFSETFYRQATDFTTPLEPAVRKIERYEPGSIVSVPVSQRFLTSLRGLVGGRKAEPVYEFVPRLQSPPPAEEGVASIDGDLRSRKVVARPEAPRLPEGASASLRSAEIEILFTVDGLGAVSAAEVSLSSGDEAVDSAWTDYLKKWQFAPLDIRRPGAAQSGRVRFKLSAPEEGRPG